MKVLSGHTRGFSTLEALAALMVMNLLLISLLGSQLKAWQVQRDTLAYQHAVELAQDLWHRMQLNHTGMAHYQLVMGDAPSSLDCQATACSVSDWSHADLADWHTALRQRIPGAQARLITQTTPESHVHLLVAWPHNSTDLGSSTTLVADCPQQHRCWETSWQP
jgi:Tfp pilus assembly protein PilV